jgi:hypothetical protein
MKKEKIKKKILNHKISMDVLEYERIVLVLPLTIPLSPNHRPKPPSEHLDLDREESW